MKINNLYAVINRVMENDLSSLDMLHSMFKPLLLKYSVLFSSNIDEMISEFDFIIMNIYKANIREDAKILKYIKTSFKNYKKANELLCIENFDIDLQLSNIESDLLFYDLIKELNAKTQKILVYKFIKQYRNSEIAKEFNVTRQYIHKKIKDTLKNLENVV